jgi:hypothetical protein
MKSLYFQCRVVYLKIPIHRIWSPTPLDFSRCDVRKHSHPKKIDGLPVEFAIPPGACADIQGLAELPLSFLKGAEIATDSAYTEYEWEDYLLETDKIKLLVARKKNSKRMDEPKLKDYKFWLRHEIETTIGEIEKLFPKKIPATNLNGFLLKAALFVFAFKLRKALFNNQQLGLVISGFALQF